MTLVQFQPYRRTQTAEMRPYLEGEQLPPTVSISAPDREAGSPKLGDMIARNPDNHDDVWLVNADYFAKNFEPMHSSPGANNEQTSSEVASIAARLIDFNVTTADKLGITGEDADVVQFCADVRTLAGSCLTQAPNREPDNFLDRLKAEREELDERLGKLAVYLGNGAPGATPRHKAMLEEQSRLMSDLLAVLDERLCDLEATARTERSHAEPENADGE